MQISAVQFCEFRTANAVSTFCLTLFCCRFTSNRGSVTGSTRRHANVLCACAIVTAIPYTSPSLQWFSDILFKLCRLSDEGGQVGVSVCGLIFRPRAILLQLSQFLRFVQPSASSGKFTMILGKICVCFSKKMCGNRSTAVLQAILILHKFC